MSAFGPSLTYHPRTKLDTHGYAVIRSALVRGWYVELIIQEIQARKPMQINTPKHPEHLHGVQGVAGSNPVTPIKVNDEKTRT